MKSSNPAIVLGFLVLACAPVKEGGGTGSSGGSSTGASSSGGSGTEAVTDGGECPAIGCGECEDGCVPVAVCVDSEVVCDCSTCVASTSTSTTGATSTGPGTTSEPETTTGETTGAELVVECGGDMPVFPEFDRSCVEDSDCTLVLHQVDCCGSQVAWGLGNDAAKSFAEAEAICQGMYPPCDCAPMPTLADDGSATENVGTLTVTCKEGSCFSGQL